MPFEHILFVRYNDYSLYSILMSDTEMVDIYIFWIAWNFLYAYVFVILFRWYYFNYFT